jgi:hypothetical protein
LGFDGVGVASPLIVVKFRLVTAEEHAKQASSACRFHATGDDAYGCRPGG